MLRREKLGLIERNVVEEEERIGDRVENFCRIMMIQSYKEVATLVITVMILLRKAFAGSISKIPDFSFYE